MILSDNIAKISAPFSHNPEENNLKTLYIPASVKDIPDGVLSFLSKNTKIYFEVSGPSATWGENWNSGIENDRIYWNK